MQIKRSILKEVVFPYAVGVFDCSGRKKVVTATELDGPCTAIWADTLEQEILWEEQGGTMNTCQLNERGDFLAIQRFYKGFNSRESRIVLVEKQDTIWTQRTIAELPFLHRFTLVKVGTSKYLICCILCADKADRNDWSQAGCVKIAKLPENPSESPVFETLIEGIHRNHGLFTGAINGKNCAIVTGDDGVFCIYIPESEGTSWTYEKLIDRPVSDATVCDLDGDGKDELITIEPFHGGKLVINKFINDTWEIAYQHPVDFGHAIWSGNFLGRPSLIIGYRSADACLQLYRLKEKRGTDWMMEIITLDQHEGPTNVAVVHDGLRERVFSCNGAKNRIVLYDVTE